MRGHQLLPQCERPEEHLLTAVVQLEPVGDCEHHPPPCLQHKLINTLLDVAADCQDEGVTELLRGAPLQGPEVLIGHGMVGHAYGHDDWEGARIQEHVRTHFLHA